MINLEYNKEAEFEIIRQEAKEEGREEERAKAEAEKLEEKFRIVKSLLQAGMSVSDVSNHSQLPREEIEKLKNCSVETS